MAKKKDMKIMIAGDQVMYSNISKSKDGYNSARLVAKFNDKEYMSVSYEWEGESVPDFALNLMGFMQANQLELGKNYDESKKHMKEEMCEDCGKSMEKCKCK